MYVCHIAGGSLPQVDTLVVTELPVGHVAVVADDLADVLGGHVLLLRVHEAKLPLLCIALGLQLLPLAGCRDRERQQGQAWTRSGEQDCARDGLLTFLL